MPSHDQRQTAVREFLRGFLGRKSLPKRITDEDAADAELRAMVRAVVRVLPADANMDLIREWLERTQDRLDLVSATWPSIPQLIENLRLVLPQDQAAAKARDGEPQDRLAEIDAKRIADGEPVGEHRLHGIGLSEVLATGLCGMDQIERYRRWMASKHRGIYGDAWRAPWEDAA